ncbi:MAG: mechanosensitive ion channel domain-containing protein [Planctomycetota bacterium]|jgi:potassium efflux system protein
MLVGLAITLWLIPAGSLQFALGQDTASESEQTEKKEKSEEKTPEALSTAAVDTAIKRIEASSDLDEAIKSEALSLYGEALNELNAAANSTSAAAKFEQRRQRAPEELGEIRARLEQARTDPASQPEAGIPTDATLESLNEGLRNARAELDALTKALRQIDDDIRKRSERRTAIPVELEAASTRVDEMTQALADPVVAGNDAEIATARRMVLSARRKAAEQQILAYNEELRYWESMDDLLNARRSDLRGLIAAAEAVVSAWTVAVTERRQVEAEEQKRQAQAQLAQVPEAIRGLVESNSELANERLKLAAEIDEIGSRTLVLTDRSKKLDGKLADLREKVDTAGMDEFIGPLLRQEQRELPDVIDQKREIRDLKSRASAIQRRLFELREIRAKLTDIDTRATELAQEVLQDKPGLDASEVQARIREVLQTRLDAVRALQKDYEECWNGIVGLHLQKGRLVARTISVAEFIDERILWVRSHPPLYRAEVPKSFVSSKTVWQAIGRGLMADVRNSKGVYSAFAAALLLWLALWRASRARLKRIDQRVKHHYSDAVGLTIQAVILEVWLLAPIVAFMLFMGARLAWAVSVSDPTAYELAQGLSAAFMNPAIPVFVVLFLWRSCRPGGIGEIQFRWGVQAARAIHHGLLPIVLIGGTAAFVFNLAGAHPDSAWRDTVARVASYVTVLGIACVIHVILHPRRGAIALATEKAELGRTRSSAGVGYFVAMAVLISPIFISAVGYHFTAVRLSRNLVWTIALVIALVVIRAMVLRFFRLAQHRVAMDRARKEMARRAAERAEADEQDAALVEEEELAFEVPAIDKQVYTLVRWAMIFATVLGTWAIWNDIFPAFSFIGRIELWSYTVSVAGGEGAEAQVLTRLHHVYLSNLLIALMLGAVTVLLARNVPNILELILFARLSIEPSARFAASTLVRYTIVIVGLAVSFGSIGIGWQQVQFLAAAITVGLGFGLQEIFANFVSGLIILFERPVRIGDTVTVGTVSGQITRIRIRATTITDWDNRELIVPNKEFITTSITNWTLSSPVTRVVIPVGIAYGSDTSLARELLLKVARDCEYVMDEPEPSAIFRSFGASSLDFDLRVYIPKRGHWPHMIDDMHSRIDEAFRKAKIEIAFPQQDVHVRTIQDALPVTHHNGPDGTASHDALEAGRRGDSD